MVGGYVFSQLLYVVAKLKLADLTCHAPQTVEELATATDTNRDALQRVMVPLVFLGVFQRVSLNAYQLAPGNEQLISTHPHSLVPYILISGDVYYKSFSELSSSLKTGRTGCETAFGQPFFDLLQSNHDFSLHFHASMSQNIAETLDTYDFSSSHHIVDIGSGKGEIASAIMQKYPHIHMTLFDLPSALCDAKAYMQQQNLTERCRFHEGDFFRDPLPGEGDTYLLSRIVHDWDDEHALQILQTCRQAMPQTSKLLLVEFVIDNQISAREALEDLFMLVVTGGRERTLERFRELLRQASLHISRVLSTKHRQCIIETVPA